MATCIGCGCTDTRACPNRCYWLRVDREDGLGVCSNCNDHVRRWDGGDRAGVMQAGRIAFRHEGNRWSAYYAVSDTMEGAIWLGAVHMGVARDPRRREAFVELMRVAVGDLLQNAVGQRPIFNAPQVAPERERAGHG